VVRALNFNRLNLSTVSEGSQMMKQFLLIGIISVFLLIAEYGIASQPAVTGHLEGVELCAQFQCGVAAFVGKFNGQLNNKRVKGGSSSSLITKRSRSLDKLPILLGANGA
jgi:hypothetical protein